MTARTGMTNIISDLRDMTDAGTADFSRGVVTFWTDDQLQTVLDRYRTELIYEPITGVLEYDTGGSVYYKRYPIGHHNLEATTGGSQIFFLQDGNFDYVGTALYSVDYRRGLVTFAADTSGSTYWLTAYSYDLNRAAVEVWQKKVNFYANKVYNIKTDGATLNRSELYQHARDMVDFYRGEVGIVCIDMGRADDVTG